MLLVLWEFRAKSNEMPGLPSPIHPAVPAKPSPSTAQICRVSRGRAGPSPGCPGGCNQGTKPAGPSQGSLYSVALQSQLCSCCTGSQSLPCLCTLLLFQFYVISKALPLIKCDCTNFCGQPGQVIGTFRVCWAEPLNQSQPALHSKERGEIWKPCLPAGCCTQGISPLPWVTFPEHYGGVGIISPTQTLPEARAQQRLVLPPESPCSTMG